MLWVFSLSFKLWLNADDIANNKCQPKIDKLMITKVKCAIFAAGVWPKTSFEN